MEKLQLLLSELKVNSNCISPEIKEIVHLSNKVKESIEKHQASIVEIQNKSQEIVHLKQEEQHLIIKIEDQEHKFHLVVEKLENLHSEYNELSGLDEHKFGAFKNIDLEYQMKVFGITTETQILKPTVVQVKISFSEDIFVIFNFDFIDNSFDLQKIEPNQIRFDEIRLFLLESRDIKGFLHNVRNTLRKQI